MSARDVLSSGISNRGGNELARDFVASQRALVRLRKALRHTSNPRGCSCRGYRFGGVSSRAGLPDHAISYGQHGGCKQLQYRKSGAMQNADDRIARCREVQQIYGIFLSWSSAPLPYSLHICNACSCGMRGSQWPGSAAVRRLGSRKIYPVVCLRALGMELYNR